MSTSMSKYRIAQQRLNEKIRRMEAYRRHLLQPKYDWLFNYFTAVYKQSRTRYQELVALTTVRYWISDNYLESISIQPDYRLKLVWDEYNSPMIDCFYDQFTEFISLFPEVKLPRKQLTNKLMVNILRQAVKSIGYKLMLRTVNGSSMITIKR